MFLIKICKTVEQNVQLSNQCTVQSMNVVNYRVQSTDLSIMSGLGHVSFHVLFKITNVLVQRTCKRNFESITYNKVIT